MNVFILGSIAFDELGQFNGRFKDLIQGSHLDKLSLSFLVENSVESLGGCAGNMAYGLGLLKCPLFLCGVLGMDGDGYREVLESWGVDVQFLTLDADHRTARAVITSDREGAQIAHFTPGAMSSAPSFELPHLAQAGDLFLAGPENPKRVLQAAEQAKAKGLRVLVDPGQILHVFTPEELLSLVHGSEVLLVNEFEWDLFQAKTGLKVEGLLEILPVLIVTRGENGATLYTTEGNTAVPAFPATPKDSTGAGDAFRAGLLAGLKKGYSFAQAAEVGAILGSACVESVFAQGYELSPDRVLALKKLGCFE